jgi:hypothetical protein
MNTIVMLSEGSSDGIDIIANARGRVRIEPIPYWVREDSYDLQFRSEHDAPITYLFFDTQIHAELRETYIRQAIRLETMEAVQHRSQWRLQFEPKTQLITLHSLRIRRGDAEVNHLNLEKAHFLQREEGLDRFVIHGWFTFLMVVEDVRPGDILEFSYTVKTQPQLLPEHCAYFFSLPQGFSIGKYRFSLRFTTTRPMRWKSSAVELKPIENCEDETTFWEWSGERSVGLRPEVNTPFWHISYPWIQISDIPDWRAIAVAISKTWMGEDGDGTTAEIADVIEREESEMSSRIEKAIRLIQDEYRYLSVNLELGGYVPTSPLVVARRRFGDCKDLSFLLVNLLKELGVPAKPILVNTFLRKSVGDFLPMPTLFNHAVVEFETEGKRRWVDTTQKEQGGGPYNRIVADYGLGLPIAAAASGLIEPPQIPGQANLFDLNESVLLDTSGAPSLLAITLRAEGSQAEILRQQLKKAGVEEMAKQRLQIVLNRFGNAKRTGSLQFRDDRALNQFVLAEVFEISPFLSPHPNNKMCRFQLPIYPRISKST